MMLAHDTPIAAAPFNDKSADITLRSSDGVHFYVHKAILSVASEFFRGIPTFPRDSRDPDEREWTVLDMLEGKKTLDILLRFYYPGKDPIIKDLWVASEVLEAAIKYKMDDTADKIHAIIVDNFIPSQPLAVFGVACRLSISCETLANKAAQQWLKQNPTWIASHNFVYEGWWSGDRFVTVRWRETSIGGSFDLHHMKQTTAGQYYRLLRCSRLQVYPFQFSLLKSEDVSPDSCLDGHILSTNRTEGDVVIHCIDGISFRSYTRVLRFMPEKIRSSMEDRTFVTSWGRAGTPSYYLPEPSFLIYKILQICDPSTAAVDTENAQLLRGLLRLGTKYDIPKVISLIQLQWHILIKDNPLRSYFAAVSLGWEELARRSALAAAFYPVEHVYVPEMEQVPSLSYYSLMEYRHECLLVLSAFVQKHGPSKRKENIKLLRMLFSVPDDDEKNESFVDRRWDCDAIVALCYASSKFSEGKDFDHGAFQSMLARSKSELEGNLNKIVLDWHSAV